MALDDDKKEETARAVNDKKYQAVSEINKANEKASDETRNLEEEQYNKDNTDLYPDADKNIAKGEGKFSPLNDRDYSTTLRLVREADRYNNMPVDKKMTFQAGATGQAGTVAYADKYDRPKLQTMETRTIDQVGQLDTQQKTAAIALQDAVNRKDLEAFKTAYAQLYGIVLSDRDAVVAMTNMVRTAETQQILTQNMEYFKRAFGTETGTDLYNMARSGKPQLSSAIASIITDNMVPPQQAEMFAQEYVNMKMQEYAEQNPNATLQDAYNYGITAYNRNMTEFSTYQAAYLKHDNSWWTNTKRWWETL